MALNPKLGNAAVNAGAAAVGALCNNGYIRIYTASQPATADTAITDQVLLAELRFGATAFGDPAAGVIEANAITPDSDANATGAAAWFRALKSDGTTPVFDGSVGTSSADLVLNSTAIQEHAAVSITTMTYTQPKSAA